MRMHHNCAFLLGFSSRKPKKEKRIYRWPWVQVLWNCLNDRMYCRPYVLLFNSLLHWFSLYKMSLFLSEWKTARTKTDFCKRRSIILKNRTKLSWINLKVYKNLSHLQTKVKNRQALVFWCCSWHSRWSHFHFKISLHLQRKQTPSPIHTPQCLVGSLEDWLRYHSMRHAKMEICFANSNFAYVLVRSRTLLEYKEETEQPQSSLNISHYLRAFSVVFSFANNKPEVESYPQSPSISFDENRSTNDDTFTNREYSFSK